MKVTMVAVLVTAVVVLLASTEAEAQKVVPTYYDKKLAEFINKDAMEKAEANEEIQDKILPRTRGLSEDDTDDSQPAIRDLLKVLRASDDAANDDQPSLRSLDRDMRAPDDDDNPPTLREILRAPDDDDNPPTLREVMRAPDDDDNPPTLREVMRAPDDDDNPPTLREVMRAPDDDDQPTLQQIRELYRALRSLENEYEEQE